MTCVLFDCIFSRTWTTTLLAKIDICILVNVRAVSPQTCLGQVKVQMPFSGFMYSVMIFQSCPQNMLTVIQPWLSGRKSDHFNGHHTLGRQYELLLSLLPAARKVTEQNTPVLRDGRHRCITICPADASEGWRC